jgi:hypothetical protein
MDNKDIREVLTALLTSIAAKARQDALAGQSDIGSIFSQDGENLKSLNAQAVEDAIVNIKKATATKEGARRLINGIMVVAKVAAKAALPPA